MAKCNDCGYPYATISKCSNCGSKNPNGDFSIVLLLILAIILLILFFLSPGIFLVSIVDSFYNLTSKVIWISSIIVSLSYLACLYFVFEEDIIRIYVWTCVIISILILLISLIESNNIFLNSISKMFSSKQVSTCNYCSSDGCIDLEDQINLDSNFTFSDVGEIKKFQNWMDENHPLWILDNGLFKNLNPTADYPTRHLNGRGYGKFGPKTAKQFSLYKNDYLNFIYPTGECDFCEIEGNCSN
jgi:hypothetical protein